MNPSAAARRSGDSTSEDRTLPTPISQAPEFPLRSLVLSVWPSSRLIRMILPQMVLPSLETQVEITQTLEPQALPSGVHFSNPWKHSQPGLAVRRPSSALRPVMLASLSPLWASAPQSVPFPSNPFCQGVVSKSQAPEAAGSFQGRRWLKCRRRKIGCPSLLPHSFLPLSFPFLHSNPMLLGRLGSYSLNVTQPVSRLPGAVQWLRLCAFDAGCAGSVPGQTRSHVLRGMAKKF